MELLNFEKFTTDEISSILTKSREILSEIYYENVNSDLLNSKRDEIRNIVHRKLKIIEIRDTKQYSFPMLEALALKGKVSINYNRYKYYYIFSDLHADFNALLLTLLNSDIICFYDKATESYIDNKNIIDKIISNKLFSGIYFLSKYEVKLLRKNTCIIILGDLVDGRRNFNNEETFYKETLNPYGVNELMIHILLYNLRLEGIHHNSTVEIIAGNHDFGSVFSNYTHFANTYVDSFSKYVLTIYPESYRFDVLYPFYLFNPSVFKVIENNGEIMSLMSHGSFSINNEEFNDNNFENITLSNLGRMNRIIKSELIEVFKNRDYSYFVTHNVSTGGLKTTVKDLTMYDETTINSNKLNLITNVIWSRYYPILFNDEFSDDSEKDKLSKETVVCNKLEEITPENQFIIMGHCIVNNFVDKALIRMEECKKRSCIFAGCMRVGIPRIVMVDNTINYSNQSTENTMLIKKNVICLVDLTREEKLLNVVLEQSNELKFTEMLLLIKDDENKLKFNIIRNNFKDPTENPKIFTNNVYHSYSTLNSQYDIVSPERIQIADPILEEDKVNRDRIIEVDKREFPVLPANLSTIPYIQTRLLPANYVELDMPEFEVYEGKGGKIDKYYYKMENLKNRSINEIIELNK